MSREPQQLAKKSGQRRRNGSADFWAEFSAMSVIPAGYKQTEAGVIPEDWKVTTLGDICEFENGDRSSNYPSGDDFTTSGIPFVNAGHVADGKIAFSAMDYITPGSFARLTRGKIKRGDILYCLRGSLGKFGIADDDFGEGAIASSLVIVRPKKSIALRHYLLCYFGSDLCAKMIETWAGGAAQPNLGVQDLARFALAVPPTQAEQEAIAEALSDEDALIESLEQLLSKKCHLKQAAMQELLTGKKRLPGFRGEWEVKSVEEFGNVVTGGTPRTDIVEYWGEGFPWITPTDIDSRRDMFASERSITPSGLSAIRALPKNTVLVTCIASIGKNAILRTAGGCNQQINALIPNGNNCAEFLYFLFEANKQYFLANAGTTATSIISKATFLKLAFTVPLMEEQTAIAAVLSDIDTEITDLETQLAKSIAMKQGMMQKLLTGEIRLI